MRFQAILIHQWNNTILSLKAGKVASGNNIINDINVSNVPEKTAIISPLGNVLGKELSVIQLSLNAYTVLIVLFVVKVPPATAS